MYTSYISRTVPYAIKADLTIKFVLEYEIRVPNVAYPFDLEMNLIHKKMLFVIAAL